jgi:hypothetical protein
MTRLKHYILRLGVLASLSLPLATSAAALTNPLGTTDPRLVIANVIKAILGITGSLALLMFVWGGIQWLISGGSPDKIKKGKDTLIWAVIGLAVIISAYAIINTLVSALELGEI